MPIPALDLVRGLADITGAPVQEIGRADRWLAEDKLRKKGRAGRSGVGSVGVDEEYAARLLLALAAPHTKAGPSLVRDVQRLHSFWYEGYLPEMPDELCHLLIGRARYKMHMSKGGPKAYIGAKQVLTVLSGLIKAAQKPKGAALISDHVDLLRIHPVGGDVSIDIRHKGAVRYFKQADGRNGSRRFNDTHRLDINETVHDGQRLAKQARIAPREIEISFSGEIFIALADLFAANRVRPNYSDKLQ